MSAKNKKNITIITTEEPITADVQPGAESAPTAPVPQDAKAGQQAESTAQTPIAVASDSAETSTEAGLHEDTNNTTEIDVPTHEILPMEVVETVANEHLKDIVRIDEAQCLWVYGDGLWHRDEKGVRLRKLLLPHIRQMLDKGEAVKACKALVNNPNNIPKLFMNLPGFEIKNAEFDSRPHLLNCLNGVADLRDGKLYRHKPSFYFTCMVPVNYRKGGHMPAVPRYLGHDLPRR